MRYTLSDLALMVDHTNLHADATEDDLRRLCDEARRYGFRMVAVNSVQSRLCAELLAGSDVHVGAAISFPLGQTSVAAKVFETRDAIQSGANEIDYVVNLTEVKAGNWSYVADEMARIVEVCRDAGAPSKVIFENCLLTQDEKIRLCEVASEVLPTFVKTSTGFSTGGATVEDVRLMREHVDARVKVKAAGGIRTADDFLAMVAAGAERIGCSASVSIMEELAARMERAGVDYVEV
ncbi:deoxyribose-phosphate aldolase [Olsenella sp. An270]|uniref:deoxyribose-phosphate aldolase n=1 Tax=Olsenella sp. An270 TaxID=1965615 RepID=UPI000B37F267|nr:deoxyribose-phosphate aldolase [Olsenella sp. An270]OUO58476.1 deoxyribose-phosphate aldolase [Olsenella sp. An270]